MKTLRHTGPIQRERSNSLDLKIGNRLEYFSNLGKGKFLWTHKKMISVLVDIIPKTAIFTAVFFLIINSMAIAFASDTNFETRSDEKNFWFVNNIQLADRCAWDEESELRLEVKPWKKSEKILFNRHLNEIFNLAPNILKLSTASRKILILRVNSTDVSGSLAESRDQAGILLIADAFFLTRKNQLHCLIHEFIHLSDCGGYVSYSKDWMSRVRSRTSKQWQLNSDWNADLSNVDFSFKYESDPCELLAEEMTEIILKEKASTSLPAKLQNLLLCENWKYYQFSRYMHIGHTCQNRKNYTKALIAYERASDFIDDAAYAWYEKYWILQKLNRDLEALNAIQKARSLLDDSKVPLRDEFYQKILEAEKNLQNRRKRCRKYTIENDGPKSVH